MKNTTPRLYRSNLLNYESSVIKGESYANGHFKEQVHAAPTDSYKYDLENFDMIKAVADERKGAIFTNQKELSICLSMDYIASSSNIEFEDSEDGGLPLDIETKISRIINSQWALDMYNTYGDNVTDNDYDKPHFMDGYIKKDDYLYITTGYFKYDKGLAYSGNFSSSEDSSDDENDYPPPSFTEKEKAKFPWITSDHRLPLTEDEIAKKASQRHHSTLPHLQTAQTIRRHYHYERIAPHQIETRLRSRRPLQQRHHRIRRHGGLRQTTEGLKSVRSIPGPPCTARQRS